ncbi:MAG: ubiquinol-cytochrome c reductase [Cyclobacteriaceae bacterium]|nr:MAG: ubiquinol-cytochrome c reductase [Cyclobacteriaceae bacterium]
MNHWLVKSEPSEYSYDDLVKDGSTYWDGVRNYAARNNLKNMKVGDKVLFYHSVKEKAVVGISKVVKEHYQDPTTDDQRWVVVDLAAEKKLKKPVTLGEIKAEPSLSDIALVRQSRLSVMPLDAAAYNRIVDMSH